MKKTAIITGGSRGIGFAIARQLGADGMNVVIMAKSPQESCSENLALLTEEKIKYAYVQGDIAQAQDRKKCLESAVAAFGGVHVLINNSGVAPKVRTDILSMTEESFDYVISVNLKGLPFFTQLVSKEMLRNDCDEKGIRGIIVNIGSISAEVSSINRGEYCVSKAGVGMATTLFADRLAEDNIRVYEVRPGIIKTEMTKIVSSKYDVLFEQGICPIARWGMPQDVADAVSVLAGGKLSYSTGEVLHVDGGFHIQRL